MNRNLSFIYNIYNINLLNQMLIKDIKFPILAIILLQFIPIFLHIPTIIQLLCYTSLSTYIAVITSIQLQLKKNTVPSKLNSLNMPQAFKLILMASAFLITIYFAYIYFDTDIVNTVILLNFSVFILVLTTKLFSQNVIFPNSFQQNIKTITIPSPFLLILKQNKIILTYSWLISTVVCLNILLIYVYTNHYILNNLYAITIAITTVKNFKISSFKVAVVFLILLFFYDMFWVYGTNVMTTVARSIKVPIKIIFLNQDNTFNIVGLGDIIFPGAFISLCAKYDVDLHLKNRRKHTCIRLRYFWVAFGAYIMAVAVTYIALIKFQSAQPALVYIVPFFIFSVMGYAIYNKELTSITKYNINTQNVSLPL